VVDRCGNSGAGGTTCGGASAGVHPIFQLDTSGKVLKNFGAGMFVSPHKLTLDKDGFLWLADNGSHQVVKLSQDGKVLMTLGKRGVAGPGFDEFDAPTEVAIAPNGDIFVGDGHSGGGTATGNARIVKFDAGGKFIKTWGKKGIGPGEFDVVHTLAFDSRGRLFVGDRQNNRIQIFDQDGKFIAQWLQFGRPSGLYIDKRTDTLYVADSESDDVQNPGWEEGIRIGDAKSGWINAFILFPWGDPRTTAGNGAEFVAVDRDGNIYGGEPAPKRLQKYVRVRP